MLREASNSPPAKVTSRRSTCSARRSRRSKSSSIGKTRKGRGSTSTKCLGEYDDWTNRNLWPRRATGDGVHAEGNASDPRTKPGLVGGVCRAYRIPAAIEKFGLPYAPGSTEDRYTYTLGSRADGSRLYDDGLKLHSENDTNPARGQFNLYDLIRIHRFGELDKGSEGFPLSELPSSRAMAKFAAGLPEVQAELMCPESEFGPLPEGAMADEERSCELGDLLPRKIPRTTHLYDDLANCGRIQDRYGSKVIAVGKSFYVWSGTHWKQDDAEVRRYIAGLPKILASEKEKLSKEIEAEKIKRDPPLLDDKEEKWLEACEKWGKKCGSRATREACAQDLEVFLDFKAVNFNLDPRYISCLNGTINLATSELLEHNPVHFITGCAPTNYSPEAQAPRFVQFMHEIFGSQELVDFVQRWLGYSITGSIIAQTVVFHVGEGGNGKGKLMELLFSILGADYYGTHSKNLLAKQPGAGTANPDLADLLGKRMVTIPETPRNFEIEDDVIKYLTGGDAITTRQLHKGNFTFMPTHKLQIFTNHRPVIHGQDHAMWRRIVLLPYRWRYGTEHEIKTGKADRLKDENLSAKLAQEREGVFAWLVAGARAWYENPLGLDVPETLRLATDQYRREEDIIGRFVEARVVVDPQARSPLTGEVGAIFTAYRGWCEERGHRPYALPRFQRELMRVVPTAREDKGSLIGMRLTDDALTR